MECHLASLQRLTCGDKTPLSCSPAAERQPHDFSAFDVLQQNPLSWEWQPALCIDWSSTNSDNKRPQNFSICCNYCKTLTPNARDWQRPYLRIHRGFNSHILHQIPTGEFDKIQFPRHHKYFLNHWNVAQPLQEAVEDDQVWTKTSCLKLYLGSSSSPFDAQSRVTRLGNKSDSSQLGHWQIQTTQIDSGPKLCRAD